MSEAGVYKLVARNKGNGQQFSLWRGKTDKVGQGESITYFTLKKPRKLAHRVMWFYQQEDLKNIAGLESVDKLLYYDDRRCN